jgi:hypothetical protein
LIPSTFREGQIGEHLLETAASARIRTYCPLWEQPDHESRFRVRKVTLAVKIPQWLLLEESFTRLIPPALWGPLLGSLR